MAGCDLRGVDSRAPAMGLGSQQPIQYDIQEVRLPGCRENLFGSGLMVHKDKPQVVLILRMVFREGERGCPWPPFLILKSID